MARPGVEHVGINKIRDIQRVVETGTASGPDPAGDGLGMFGYLVCAMGLLPGLLQLHWSLPRGGTSQRWLMGDKRVFYFRFS